MKGLLFTECLFSKVIGGTKTQTRRLMKEQPKNKSFYSKADDYFYNDFGNGVCGKMKQPRYKVGEVVYLKEPYVQEAIVQANDLGAMYEATGNYRYKYAGHSFSVLDKDSVFGHWKNKMFMPQSAARYFIEITAVRAERLQDISDEDCLKEGIYNGKTNYYGYLNGFDNYPYKTPQKAYAVLINKINGKGIWESNPFVWIYDFKLCKKPN